MKTLCTVCGCLLLSAALAFAAQDAIYTKSGKTYTGTVKSTNDAELVIETASGTFTFPWRVLDDRTLRQYNEELFKKVKAAEFKEKGFVEYKGKWMTPKTKETLEMKDKGYERFEGKWLLTNEVAEIKQKRAEEEFRKSQQAKGMVEYKGKWYTEEEAEGMKEMDANKGLRLGMTQKKVLEAWGEPNGKKDSPEFKSRQREMWIYSREKEDKEDRLVFEMGILKEVYLDKEPTL